MCNLVQSDRFWTDLQEIVKLFEPCLYILRLADRETPAMDQLYFYVRKMDKIVSTLKMTLNQMEEKYNKQNGPNIDTNIMNYFLRSKDNLDLKSVLEPILDLEEDDDSSISDESEADNEEEEDDEMLSDNESSNVDDDNKCGNILENAWNRRSKALRTDVAIAGWFCSPYQEVMDDCSENHTGEHKTAVTRLLRKWFCHEVRING